MLPMLWWGLLLLACYQANKAWGIGAAVAALVGVYLVTWVPLVGGILSVFAMCAVGLQAENHQSKLLEG